MERMGMLRRASKSIVGVFVVALACYASSAKVEAFDFDTGNAADEAVSYTHLTLPTILRV